MAVLEKPTVNPAVEALFIGAEQMDELRAIVARQFEELGIEYNPDVIPQDLRHAMVAAGIQPEENFLSGGIIEARAE